MFVGCLVKLEGIYMQSFLFYSLTKTVNLTRTIELKNVEKEMDQTS